MNQQQSIQRSTMTQGLAALAAAALAFSVFSAFMDRNAYQQLLISINTTADSFGTAQSMFYGTIESVDTASGTIVIARANPFDPSLDAQHVAFAVPPYARIARQDMTMDPSGIYTGFGPKTAVALGDLPPGAHVAVLAMLVGNRTLDAVSITFGDPL